MATAIEFNHVSKMYRLGLVGTGTIRDDLKRWWAMSVMGKEDPFLIVGQTNDRASKSKSDFVYALKDIDFKVEQGDVVGIIGKNGAGKSTLLKLLSRITAPTTGTIKAKGRIASLLEVGTGFHGELTGRENIYMNGSIMGMRKHEIDRKLDEIVDFSGCEMYIDTPVKRYSSGMTVRLGFAVAAFLEPEILIVDEVLAVGDAEFQKKAIGKMQDVSTGEGRTVLFVSHNMDSILNLCHNGILLENGEVSDAGRIVDVVDAYMSKNGGSCCYESKNSRQGLFIEKVYFVGTVSQTKGLFNYGDRIKLKLVIRNIGILKIDKNCIAGIAIFHRNTKVCTTEISISDLSADRTVEIEIDYPSSVLAPGNYSLEVAIHIPNKEMIEDIKDVCNFTIRDTGTSYLKYGKNNGIIILSPIINKNYL